LSSLSLSRRPRREPGGTLFGPGPPIGWTAGEGARPSRSKIGAARYDFCPTCTMQGQALPFPDTTTRGPNMETAKRKTGEEAKAARRVRLAALGDIHCGKASQGAYHDLFRFINENADVFVLCGDLTDHGLPEEAQVLAREMNSLLKVPTVAVL